MPLALATLVHVDGSSYRQPGACMLCSADGEVLAGAISGGCLEADVALRAADVCASGRAERLTYDLREDLETIWGFGTGCFGAAHLVLAPLTDLAPWHAAVDATANRRPATLRVESFDVHILPPVHCVVVGHTQGAAAVAEVATQQGWRVSRMPHHPDEVGASLARGDVPLDERTVVALCTHRFASDLDWLRLLMSSRVPYIGILGARQRAVRLLDTLAQEGTTVDAAVRARIFAPLGLDIGAESPDEIALSAVAEMHAVINGRKGASLKHRATPLHVRAGTDGGSAGNMGAPTRTPVPDVPAARIPAIILAAGASRRLGEPKQLLRDAAGVSLLRRLVQEAIDGGCAPVYVVVGAHEREIRALLHDTYTHVIPNASWEEGMSTSIRAGIDAVRAHMASGAPVDGVLLMPCDQPAVSAPHIRALRAGFEDARLEGPVRIVSRYQGVLGTPAIWPVHDFDALRALSGDRGARALLHGIERAIDLVDGALDVDTPEDLAAWRAAESRHTTR